METKKKKLSKKTVIIGSIILAVVLAVGSIVGVIIHNREPQKGKEYTLEEISHGLSKKVSYIVDKDNVLTQEERDEIYDRYKTRHFLVVCEEEIPWWEGLGEITSHLLFYDENDKFLFEIYETQYSFITIPYKGTIYNFQMVNV